MQAMDRYSQYAHGIVRRSELLSVIRGLYALPSLRTVCVCVYIYIYIYTYIHTHTLTHTLEVVSFLNLCNFCQFLLCQTGKTSG